MSHTEHSIYKEEEKSCKIRRNPEWDNTTLYTKFDTGFSKKQFL